MNTIRGAICRIPRGMSTALGLLAGFLLIALSSAAIPAQPQKDKKTQPAKGVLTNDKGTLKIALDGKPVGSEQFDIGPSDNLWVAHGTTDIHAPGAPGSQVKSTFRLHANGAPQSYEFSFQGDRKAGAKVTFQDGVAKTTLQFGEAKPFEREVTFGTPLIAVLDNNMYHHYAILARVYDWTKKGAQTFPVLIPQDMTQGSITAEAGASQSIDGKSFETLKITTTDLEVHLFLDANHRLMRLEVPASKVVVTRE
jgi:hypothetical protein